MSRKIVAAGMALVGACGIAALVIIGGTLVRGLMPSASPEESKPDGSRSSDLSGSGDGVVGVGWAVDRGWVVDRVEVLGHPQSGSLVRVGDGVVEVVLSVVGGRVVSVSRVPVSGSGWGVPVGVPSGVGGVDVGVVDAVSGFVDAWLAVSPGSGLGRWTADGSAASGLVPLGLIDGPAVVGVGVDGSGRLVRVEVEDPTLGEVWTYWLEIAVSDVGLVEVVDVLSAAPLSLVVDGSD